MHVLNCRLSGPHLCWSQCHCIDTSGVSMIVIVFRRYLQVVVKTAEWEKACLYVVNLVFWCIVNLRWGIQIVSQSVDDSARLEGEDLVCIGYPNQNFHGIAFTGIHVKNKENTYVYIYISMCILMHAYIYTCILIC